MTLATLAMRQETHRHAVMIFVTCVLVGTLQNCGRVHASNAVLLQHNLRRVRGRKFGYERSASLHFSHV